MKRFILLFISLFLAIESFAQLEVKDGSFKEVPGFVNINPDPNYQNDDNDLPFAVIKIRTENINDKQRHELNFSGNAGTFIMLEYKEGEVWVYLTAKYATYLKISHPDLSSTEFHFPYDLTPKCGYEFTLSNTSANINSGTGTLTIISKPEKDATITINGKVISYKTPYTNDIIPSGKYNITISKERYKPVTQNIVVNNGDNTTIEIDMPIDVATITLSADYDTEIYIDSVYMKKGTWTGELYSGSHVIGYKKQFHNDASQTIQVEAGKSQKIELKPTPINGTISVDTEPSGAMVYIDNLNVGTTPVTTSYIIGNHNIRIDKNGFESLSWNVTIKENDTLFYNKTLIEVTHITIQTGAYDNIYIDGRYEGISPVKKKLSIGKHTIEVQRVNYKPIEQDIVVEPDGEKVFNIIVDPNNDTFTKKEPSNRRSDNSYYIDDAYYRPGDDNYQSNNLNDLDLSFHFDIGCFAGLGYKRIKPYQIKDKNTFYFAKGLYSVIKINNFGIKAEFTNISLSGNTYYSYDHNYPIYRSKYTYNFSLVNIPIMIGFDYDKGYGLFFSAYIGQQINICNSATFEYIEEDYSLDIVSSTNQPINNYLKTSRNLIGEISAGWSYKNFTFTWISFKFDIERPTLVNRNDALNLSDGFQYYSWSMCMQLHYHF